MGNGSVYWIGTDGNAWLKASDGKVLRTRLGKTQFLGLK